ncbi:MAG: hypothetical protein ABGY71_08020 [bacterium]|nr:hypothetical protein [Planctomycetota bacterium]HIL50681.1 hypothetical protein [Planctomycetota bacterium]
MKALSTNLPTSSALPRALLVPQKSLTLPWPGRWAAAVGASLAVSSSLLAQQPWPAETLLSADNLTAIEGPGINDFHTDLSGAVWNPSTRTLWVCDNGVPGRLWAAREDGLGGYEIAEQAGLRGEWTGFGDIEGVTQADWDEPSVFVIIEGEEHIKEYDVSTFGVAILKNDWNTRPFLPLLGGKGAEAITFVPDSALVSAEFVNGSGSLYQSAEGMDGLMFVGHQNGGAIFVFDLNRSTGAFVFVGEYTTDRSETAGLEFDRSSGNLYAWHDAGFDILSVLDLSSTALPGTGQRAFTVVEAFMGPSHANHEGIAVVSNVDTSNSTRSFFMTTDDGGTASLLRYADFTHGCLENPVFCGGDNAGVDCPCGNNAGGEGGCGNSLGVGMLLDSTGSNSITADDLGFLAGGLIPGNPALLFSGTLRLNTGLGMPFGDGLRCVGGATRRLAVRLPTASGDASWGPGYATNEGWLGGQTRYFQVWYRDPGGGPCLGGFNLSNGLEVTFTP